MAIARRSGRTLDPAIAIRPAPVRAPQGQPTGTPVPLGDAPAPDAVTPRGRLRRCTYRRVDQISPLPQRAELPVYEIMCLFGDARAPLPLGDVAAAQPICDACTASGIFRPDED